MPDNLPGIVPSGMATEGRVIWAWISVGPRTNTTGACTASWRYAAVVPGGTDDVQIYQDQKYTIMIVGAPAFPEKATASLQVCGALRGQGRR